MATYMLARLKLRYGVPHVPRYDAAMMDVREFFEAEGVMLEQALMTNVGPLYKAWNLWRVDDPTNFSRAPGRLHDPAVYARYADMLNTLADFVIEEDLSLVEFMPFFLAAPSPRGA